MATSSAERPPGRVEGPLRAWLVSPQSTAEDTVAFAGYTRELTTRLWPKLGLGLAVAALLWWPLDAVVYPESAAVREGFADFRGAIVGLDVGLAWLLPRLAFTARHAHATAAMAAIANLLLAGWFLAEVGQGDPLWFSYAFMTPLFSVLLLVPLRTRVGVGFAFTAAILATWIAHPAVDLARRGATAGVSYLCFCTCLAIFIGHLLYVQVQRSFYLGRHVERQRVALEELAVDLERKVLEQTEVIRELGARAQKIRAEQRQELAREVHDGIGQELTSMRLLVELGAKLHDEPGAGGTFTALREQIERTMVSLRRVLESLRPQPLEEGSLLESLAILVGELGRRSGLACSFVHAGRLGALPPELDLALYRIAQEGLTNAIRHARARHLELRLTGDDDAITLEVHDDGEGMAPRSVGRGFGTRGILERASALGGQASWSLDQGTRLVVTLPRAGAR